MNQKKSVIPIPIMPKEFHYATAYIPYQYFCNIFEPEKGLKNGTIFPELIDDITQALS